MNQKQSKADELFFVVDEQDQPLAPLPRKLVHGHGVWHRVAHVWLVNDRGEVLCQQRALTKELSPGLWEAFFGGHMAPDETYEQAATRELQEELAITPPPLTFWKVCRHISGHGYNNEFQGIFVARWNGKIDDVTFDDGEVEKVKWVSISDAQAAIHAGEGWTCAGYELELLQDITNGKI
jgi:8-oxo-dGTP pyrophosphatase MutT (NUDIX family)